MPVSNWTTDILPRLDGKRCFITGGNSGIGLDTARHLRRAGAHVVIAARSAGKGNAAVANLTQGINSTAPVELVALDLASNDSIKRAADDMHSRFADGFDAIINNAGIMFTPQQQTADGYEMQFGTNHLGHFLLNALTIDLVAKRQGRIVPVASIAHRQAQGINFDDIMLEKNYVTAAVYSQSKLANLLYGAELAQKMTAAGSSMKTVCAHPGYSAINLQSTGPTGPLKLIGTVLNPLIAQPSRLGAYPSALAAAGDEAFHGAYYGPTKMGGMRGPVGDSFRSAAAQDMTQASQLWSVSEELVGTKFEVPSA